MPVLSTRKSTDYPDPEHGPLRLGQCKQDGWRDQPGFPCYKWMWFHRGDTFPTIRCMCGGSYPRPPPPGLIPETLDTILADPVYANQLVGRGVAIEDDFSATETERVPASDGTTTKCNSTTRATASVLNQMATHLPMTVTLTPPWPPIYSMIPREDFEITGRTDYTVPAMIVFCIVVLILGFSPLHRRSKRELRATNSWWRRIKASQTYQHPA